MDPTNLKKEKKCHCRKRRSMFSFFFLVFLDSHEAERSQTQIISMTQGKKHNPSLGSNVQCMSSSIHLATLHQCFIPKNKAAIVSKCVIILHQPLPTSSPPTNKALTNGFLSQSQQGLSGVPISSFPNEKHNTKT